MSAVYLQGFRRECVRRGPRFAQRGDIVRIGSIPPTEAGLFTGLKSLVLHGDWRRTSSAKRSLIFWVRGKYIHANLKRQNAKRRGSNCPHLGAENIMTICFHHNTWSNAKGMTKKVGY